MLATEMTSSLHSRAYHHPPAFANSGVTAQPTPYGPASSRLISNGSNSELFSPQIMDRPPPSEAPKRNENIMNRRGDGNSSLYQICLNLKRRMARVPNFDIHIAEMEEEEAEANDSTDPVTSMWNCLRRGYPLMSIYNALMPHKPITVDASRMAEAKVGKAATFKFLQACLTDLKFPASECFLITDLYGGDTTGFVKVTKVVNRVLDLLEQRGILLQTNNYNKNGDNAEPQKLNQGQNLVRELVVTERDYVQHLEILQQFKKELEECGAIPGDALHDIFLNLNALLDFQRRFLIRIEQQNSLPESQQNWGQLFIQYKESFRVYEPFIANQVRCNNAVLREWDKIKAAPVSSDVEGIVEIPSILISFLIKPFQRLSKYPLLLEQLRKTGELDEERKIDLVQGMAAATSILFRANEAVSKEQRLAAVSELQSRVEDWKGHQIDHFGDLLLFGDYTVVKGEGQKEVEREVCQIFDSLNLQCRQEVRRATQQPIRRSQLSKDDAQTRQQPRPSTCGQGSFEGNGFLNASTTLHDPEQSSPYPRRFVSGLAEVPEEKSDKADEEYTTEESTPTPSIHTQAVVNSAGSSAKTTPTGRSMPSKTRLLQVQKVGSVDSLSTALGPTVKSRSFQKLDKAMTQPVSHEGLGTEGSFVPPTPSRKSKVKSPGLLSDFGQKMRVQSRKVRAVLQTSRNARPDQFRNLYVDAFNGCLANDNEFHAPKFWQLPEGARDPWKPLPADMGAVTRTESEFCESNQLTCPVRVQYKVYLFERILLCCKEINPNKPKNKMMGSNKSLVDKKGKPRLQLKGRIFMQNVTDVVTVVKSEKQDYKVQIFWKGDPGVEHFIIRFLQEGEMNTWGDQVRTQKKALGESARSSGQTGTSETEFLAMKDQTPPLKNPYLDEDADDDDSQAPTVVPGSSNYSMSQKMSNNSLRSAGPTMNGSLRGAPPRFPMPEPGAYQPPLSLQTNIAPAVESPGEVAGNSYFSPGGDSPMSTRSNSQASMYPFSRQTTPRLSNEDSRHRTAPAMPRAPSRDGACPINGFMVGPQNVQQQSRLRSASTPDIQTNPGGSRRYANGQLQPSVENVPVPPIPPHMRAPIARSQTSSPTNGTLPTRNNVQTPMYQRDRTPRPHVDQSNNYDRQMQQRLQAIPHTEHSQYQEGSYADASLKIVGSLPPPTPAPAYPSEVSVPYPPQVKVKVSYQQPTGHITIVVPTIIKCRSLIERIDSKMNRFNPRSIAAGEARLKYVDEDNDTVTIRTDEDVQIALDDWFSANKEQLRNSIVPELHLYWTPWPEEKKPGTAPAAPAG